MFSRLDSRGPAGRGRKGSVRSMRGTPRWREVSPLEAGHLLDTAGEERAESQVLKWTRHVGAPDACDPTRWPQLTYPESQGLFDPQNVRNLSPWRNLPAIFLPTEVARINPVTALPGWGRTGRLRALSPAGGRVWAIPFSSVPGSSTPVVRNPDLWDTQEPSFPQVRGAGTPETEQGPGGGNSPNRPPLHLQGVGWGGCESVGGACTISSLEPPSSCGKLTGGQR